MGWKQNASEQGDSNNNKKRKEKRKKKKIIFFLKEEKSYHQHELKGLAIYVLSTTIFCVTQCIMLSKQNKS